VRALDLPGHPARFECRTGDDDHHHLVCRSCGRIDDVEKVADEAPCATPPGIGSFDVETAEITFWGTCPGCAGRA
jgi:Fur family ferric uptake transcriptional regulator